MTPSGPVQARLDRPRPFWRSWRDFCGGVTSPAETPIFDPDRASHSVSGRLRCEDVTTLRPICLPYFFSPNRRTLRAPIGNSDARISSPFAEVLTTA